MQPVAAPGDGTGNGSSAAPQALADHVSSLVLAQFSELTDAFTSPYARRKVLAGVVMTTSDDHKDAQVSSNTLYSFFEMIVVVFWFILPNCLALCVFVINDTF